MSDRLFRDRRDAGHMLAGLLDKYRGRPDVLVLALPRGGVPVAYEVATALGAPLDVLVARKLGLPGREELAMGAIASGGVRVLNEDLVRALRISPGVIQWVTEQEGRELVRREQAYREGRPAPDVARKIVILVDDGLATGASMRAAVLALRQLDPARVVVAIPAAPESSRQEISALADEVACVATPSPFVAVGVSYQDFTQTTDEEVRDLLRAATAAGGAGHLDTVIRAAEPADEPADGGADETADGGAMDTARIPVAGVVLEGDITTPPPGQGPTRGLVLFAHGSGSSRHSPRNRYVAAQLQVAGLATVLVDLLTPEEERIDSRTGELRFDITLLSVRLAALVDWLSGQEYAHGLGIGLFGASTGAAAALVATAARPGPVRAVVSRGGRPDLAGEFLRLVRRPTLLIVGARDQRVIELNRLALRKLAGETRMEIVPGATHLFEEPGALEEVARLARDWFISHVTAEPEAPETPGR
jgi:putative phosphoribosyl transferase